MKVHFYNVKKEHESLKKALEDRDFKIVKGFDELGNDSIVIVDSETSAKAFKEKNCKVLACCIIIKKSKDYGDVEGLAQKYFVYSLVEEEKHHEYANKLNTELLFHTDAEELLEEVLIDIISIQHSQP